MSAEKTSKDTSTPHMFVGGYVYQAYNAPFANYTVAHQLLGRPHCNPDPRRISRTPHSSSSLLPVAGTTTKVRRTPLRTAGYNGIRCGTSWGRSRGDAAVVCRGKCSDTAQSRPGYMEGFRRSFWTVLRALKMSPSSRGRSVTPILHCWRRRSAAVGLWVR